MKKDENLYIPMCITSSQPSDVKQNQILMYIILYATKEGRLSNHPSPLYTQNMYCKLMTLLLRKEGGIQNGTSQL